jgi:ADP-ribosylglycohydrolase
MKTASHSAQADRAAGAIVGAFIGDALGVGPHWYYDLDEMRNAFKPWIDGYTAPKPGRYHDGLQPGDLSQTGLIMEILLRSTMDRGGYDEQDFCRRLDEDFLPQLDGAPHHGPGGYTNHSFRQVWQNRVQERQPWGHTGGNADTSEAAERLTILSARYASDPGHLAHFALGNCELSQNDSLVAQQSVAFALVLAALIRGEPFDEELSGKLMDLGSKFRRHPRFRLSGRPSAAFVDCESGARSRHSHRARVESLARLWHVVRDQFCLARRLLSRGPISQRFRNARAARAEWRRPKYVPRLSHRRTGRRAGGPERNSETAHQRPEALRAARGCGEQSGQGWSGNGGRL